MSKASRAYELSRLWRKGEEARLELAQLMKDLDHPVRALDLDLEQVPGAAEIAEQQRTLQEQSLGAFHQGQAGGLGQSYNDWVQQGQAASLLIGCAGVNNQLGLEQQALVTNTPASNAPAPKPPAPKPSLARHRRKIEDLVVELFSDDRPRHVREVKAALHERRIGTIHKGLSDAALNGRLVRVRQGVYRRP